MRHPTARRPIDAALVYAHRGWLVLPCHSPARGVGGCTCCRSDCSSPGKHPRIAGGLGSATTDAAIVRRWWGTWPRANVAIRTGAASGLVVLDIDPEHGGEETMSRVLEEHGDIPLGRVIRTGSGGRHLYFRHPGGTVRNDTGRRLGPGVDIRGDGGYAIAPPSQHASGRQYVVTARGNQLLDLPGWLLGLMQPCERPPPPREAGRVTNASAWAGAAVDGELARLGSAKEGTRNDTLNRVAYRLGQLVGGGSLSEAEIERLLVEQGMAIGLGEREAIGTVRSGLRAGEGVPRDPTPRPDGRSSGPDLSMG